MRRKPYTERGIRRLKCFRADCENRAETQWQICADGNVYRPICLPCDIQLNRMVLEWAGDPEAAATIEAYRESRNANLIAAIQAVEIPRMVAYFDAERRTMEKIREVFPAQPDVKGARYTVAMERGK